MRRSRSALICLFAVAIQGCSYIPNELLEKDIPANVTLPAMKDWTSSGVVRVLLVHGMGDHPFGTDSATQQPVLLKSPTYADLSDRLSSATPGTPLFRDAEDAATNSHFKNLISQLTTQLGYGSERKEQFEFQLIYDSAPSTGKRTVVGYWFSRSFSDSEQSPIKLKFYVVEYAFAGAVKKESQFGSWDGHSIIGHFQDFDPKINSYRHKLNRTLKLSIVDWGLGDASLYLGKYGDKYRYAVSTAIQKVALDLQESDHLAIVTESLGSTVALDALRKLLPGRHHQESDRLFKWLENPRGSAVAGGSKIAFYMCANQFGLLHVASGEPSQKTQTPLMELDQTLTSVTKIPLISFTDPDDLLSYWVSPGLRHFDVCNVLVRNKKTEYLPVVLDLADPLAAHLNYDQNPRVLKLMLQGSQGD